MGIGERSRCPRCRAVGHRAYECLLDESSCSPGAPVLRIAWTDRGGGEWISYICRDHVRSFVARHLAGDELVTLHRSDYSEWERACDLCVHGPARRPLRLAHRLRELRPSRFAHPRAAASLALEVAALSLVVLVFGALLPHLRPWQVVALTALAVAMAPWAHRKLSGALARFEGALRGAAKEGRSPLTSAVEIVVRALVAVTRSIRDGARRSAAHLSGAGSAARAAGVRYAARFAADAGDERHVRTRSARSRASQPRRRLPAAARRGTRSRPAERARSHRTVVLPEVRRESEEAERHAVSLGAPSYAAGEIKDAARRCWSAPD